MNKKLVFNVTGKLLLAISGILLLPALISAIYQEKSLWAFLITSLISLIVGIVLKLLTRGYNNVMYAKEGFLIVALAWVSTSLIGSLPFVISGEIPNFFDAFFETCSGFSTTGASIVGDVEALSHGILFWRSFTHWIGGMGVLVFMIAFISNISDRSIHILRAEMPGPIVGKLTPRAKDTSKVLYIIYFVMTVVQVVLLTAGDM
ncbi:MAG: TrkH family potassium uptake protein, partial [Clostridia bacterium]|nr:TrkH family potassium uptake protein [Clostridia bacterium]